MNPWNRMPGTKIESEKGKGKQNPGAAVIIPNNTWNYSSRISLGYIDRGITWLTD